MKKLIPLLLISVASFGQVKTAVPKPSPFKLLQTARSSVVKQDTIHIAVRDTTVTFVYNSYSVTDFGAHPGASYDNANAFQAASDYIIQHPGLGSNLYIPPGDYYTSRPWILQKVQNGMWQFFTIHIFGDAPAKSSPTQYLTNIFCSYNTGFGIGVQFGRDIRIENINIAGQYQPPPVNIYNIGTTIYSDWNTGSTRHSRFSPYSGIAIDPFCDSNNLASGDRYQFANSNSQYLPNTGRGGTSGAKINNCSVKNFEVGIVLTPNGYTQNDEDIDIVDDNIFACKVNIAICQDQSKAITIERLKSWGPTYTVLDGLNYGSGTGGGSTFCSIWNIAGCVNQLINVNVSRFPISLFGIYAESLFRIGGAYGLAGCNFVNCQIDLLTGPGMPAADYVFAGGPATYSGGMLRYYDGTYLQHRMNLNDLKMKFRDMTFNNFPITAAVYGLGTNTYPVPTFDNITYFYNTQNQEGFRQAWPIGPITIDRIHWTASLPKPNDTLTVGSYLLGGPTDATKWYYDRGMNPTIANTIQIGRIIKVTTDSVFLDDVGLNCFNGSFGAVFIDSVK